MEMSNDNIEYAKSKIFLLLFTTEFCLAVRWQCYWLLR